MEHRRNSQESHHEDDERERSRDMSKRWQSDRLTSSMKKTFSGLEDDGFLVGRVDRQGKGPAYASVTTPTGLCIKQLKVRRGGKTDPELVMPRVLTFSLEDLWEMMMTDMKLHGDPEGAFFRTVGLYQQRRHF